MTRDERWDPVRPSQLRQACERYGFRPNRSLGQNFLIDRNVLERLLMEAAVAKGDAVFEIGAGAGALTRRLAERARQVISVEVDERLRPLLAEALAAYDNVRLVFGDALALDWRALLGSHPSWKLVANVPYGITAPLLLRALRHEPPFERMVLMVQREVAERLVASPGGKDYGALTVLAHYYANVRAAFTVSPRSFWPRPQVWSAVVVLEPVLRPDLPPPERFFRIVRAAFGRRRKMLRNALGDNPYLDLGDDEVEAMLQRAGIDGDRRAETLTLEEFARLARSLDQR